MVDFFGSPNTLRIHRFRASKMTPKNADLDGVSIPKLKHLKYLRFSVFLQVFFRYVNSIKLMYPIPFSTFGIVFRISWTHPSPLPASALPDTNGSGTSPHLTGCLSSRRSDLHREAADPFGRSDHCGRRQLSLLRHRAVL